MIPVVCIRPEPGCTASCAAGRAAGLQMQAFPLFAIAPCDWRPVAPAQADALLIGSANALRRGGEQLARYRGKPAYAVGAATALACREAGLVVAAEGHGGLQSVLDHLDPAHRRLLRLCGEARVPLSPPAGVTITERIVYASRPLPIPDALTALLTKGPAVLLLHSAEAARHIGQECKRVGLNRGAITLAAIGPRVAEAAQSGWAAVHAAAAPDDAALLALAGQLCHKPVGSDRECQSECRTK